jgi:hypothetical protein
MMIRVKYGAMIGRETHFLYVIGNNFQAMDFLKPITSLFLTLVVKPWNFAKRQCTLQWLTPPIFFTSFSNPPLLAAEHSIQVVVRGERRTLYERGNISR